MKFRVLQVKLHRYIDGIHKFNSIKVKVEKNHFFIVVIQPFIFINHRLSFSCKTEILILMH